MRTRIDQQAQQLADSLDSLDKRISGVEGKSDLAFSSIEDGQIQEKDLDGNLVASVGKQFDGSHVAVPYTGPKPATPVAATLKASPGAVEVRWNGKFTDAQVSSLDFKHAAVHASRTPMVDATPSTQVATIRGELGDVATLILDSGTWYFALVAWTTAGKASEPSAIASVEVPAVIDMETVTVLISEVQLSVDGKTTIHNSTLEPTPGDHAEGDRWQRWSTLIAGGTLQASWRWTAGAWIEEKLDPSYLPKVDIGEGTFGSLGGERLEADAIDGMVITGPTIRSSATGRRTQQDQLGFHAWNAAGVETVKIDGENNRITGKVTTNEPGQPGVILVPRSSSGVTGMWFSQNGTEDGDQPAIFTDASGNITIRPKVQTPLQTVFIMGNLIIKDKFTSEVGMSAQGPFYSSQGESVVQSLKIAAHPTSSVAPNAIIATNPYGVMYRSTSSRRYKKYISKWEPDPDGVLALVPKRWQDRKQADVPADSRYYVGFIAEEVAEVYPELVSFMDYEDGNGPVPESVDYERFCAVLTLKAQQQENRLAQLATENTELNDRLAAMDARLAALETKP